MKRLAMIEIPLFDLQEIDAFDIGEILQNLPEDTKIVSFGEQLHRAVLTIVVSNPKFKEIDLCKEMPVIKYSGSDYESFTVDCDHLFEPQEEVVFERIQPFDVPSFGQFKNGENIFYDMGKSIEPRTGYRSAIPSNNDFKYIQYEINKLHSQIIETQKQMGIPQLLISSTPCNHQWKSYQGLIETYDFCEKCQEKK